MSSIPLYVSNGKAYCWEAQDLANLRVKHHIAGLNTGTLPGVSQQNVFLGLPNVLMPEEVVLLVHEGICHLVHTPQAIRLPTASEIEAHTRSRVEDVEAMQQEAYETSLQKRKQFERQVGDKESVQRKREERRKAKAAAKAATQQQQEGSDEVNMFQPEEEESVVQATPTPAPSPMPPSKAPATTSYFTTVPATSTMHPWFDPEGQCVIFEDLECAREARVWAYPSTRLERARCMSYRRMWERGMFLGQGIKFGGEFLVYPGDPMRYHSHFVNTTLPTPDTIIRPMELVAWGRLGTATKKAHLICCYDEDARRGDGEKPADQGEIEFYSLEWGNFG